MEIYLVILALIILSIGYALCGRRRCPRCEQHMDSQYNPENGVSYEECSHCGYIEITGMENHD